MHQHTPYSKDIICSHQQTWGEILHQDFFCFRWTDSSAILVKGFCWSLKQQIRTKKAAAKQENTTLLGQKASPLFHHPELFMFFCFSFFVRRNTFIHRLIIWLTQCCEGSVFSASKSAFVYVCVSIWCQSSNDEHYVLGWGRGRKAIFNLLLAWGTSWTSNIQGGQVEWL